MPAQDISASVGQGGVNQPGDVVIVQNLLIARGFPGIGTADGDCGPKTIAAIKAYQAGFLRKPDGKVDPGGTTWRHLSAAFTGSTDTPPPAGAAGNILKPVPRPAAHTINVGLTAVSNSYMLAKLGQPLLAGGYNAQCQTPTNPKLRRNLVTDTVGPFRVTGLVPAVLSLKAVMADIAAEQPTVHKALGTAGMLCCRLVRGSASAISNHSWGTAIDLTLNGVLDAYGDNQVQVGLTLIAPIFNRHGWYWGAAFGKEDGMHFEGSKANIDAWAAQLS
jgi:peptidoglycan hydrolase-like protein with peptidoglycan-binding domain